jgi:hypothetical protein
MQSSAAAQRRLVDTSRRCKYCLFAENITEDLTFVFVCFAGDLANVWLMANLLPSHSILTITGDELSGILKDKAAPSTLIWGRTHIGVSLLKALQNDQILEFDDVAEVENFELNGSNHLVVA